MDREVGLVTSVREGSPQGQHGFSLIELLVALFILSVTALGLCFVATATASGNTRGKDHATAAALAAEKLEELKSAGFARLEPGSGNEGSLEAGGEQTAGGVFWREWQIADESLNGLDARRIRVAVSWTNGGSVALSTVLVDVPEDGGTGVPSAFVESWNQVR